MAIVTVSHEEKRTCRPKETHLGPHRLLLQSSFFSPSPGLHGSIQKAEPLSSSRATTNTDSSFFIFCRAKTDRPDRHVHKNLPTSLCTRQQKPGKIPLSIFVSRVKPPQVQNTCLESQFQKPPIDNSSTY